MTNKITSNINPFLDEERIRKIQEILFDYARRFGKRFPDNDEEYAKYLVKKYAFCTSVLIGLLGNDVSAKRILEVGPGYAGRFMLDYLVEERIDAIGTDPYCDYRDYSGPSQGRYVSSAMEKLSETFDIESVDLINIMTMYPDPCPMEIKRMQEFGNLFQRIKANRYYKRYPSRVSYEINQILKNKGHLLLWSRPYNYDFRLKPTHLIEKGFSYQTIEIPTSIMSVAFNLDIYQKQVIL